MQPFQVGVVEVGLVPDQIRQCGHGTIIAGPSPCDDAAMTHDRSAGPGRRGRRRPGGRNTFATGARERTGPRIAPVAFPQRRNSQGSDGLWGRSETGSTRTLLNIGVNRR
ncbi:hypothetical protein GCM10009780_40210 [Actinomadura alba]